MDDARYHELSACLFGLFSDPAADEALVTGQAGLWLLAAGARRPVPSPFDTALTLLRWAQRLAREGGVRLDPVCGAAGGALRRAPSPGGAPEDFRWHCVLPPLAPDGPVLSLRRHRFAALGVAAFAGDPAALTALARVVRARRPLVVAGPTGAGKTTLLAALLREAAPDERVVVVESLAELPLLSPLWVRLVERRPNLEGVGAFPARRLVQEALRLRPDRLVIGEVRADEAGAFADALATGHGGVLTTLHADSPAAARRRLAALAGESAGDFAGVSVAVLGRGSSGKPTLLAVSQAD